MPVIPKEEWDSVQQYLEYLRHLAAYALFAQEFVAAKDVLEIGCGAGYGAEYLSESASHITAVDISKEGVSQYWDRYSKGNVRFMLGDGNGLPFKHSSFDVVMSFQVIEHIEPKFVLAYLAEIRRVLKTGGIFICSTPNKKLRLLPFQKPRNPEHKKEYNRRELKILLKEIFEEVKVYGLYGSEEIQANVRNGLKQSPFKVYIQGPIYRLILYHFPSPVVSWLKRVRQHFVKIQTQQKTMPQKTFAHTLSLGDFRIDPTCPEDSLDLYGVCTKARQ